MSQTTTPTRVQLFELLASHTDRMVAGAQATLRLTQLLGQNSAEMNLLIEEVNQNETSADEIKALVFRLVYEAYTTPVNRDQIHTLIIHLDRVLDTIQSVANSVAFFDLKKESSTAVALAQCAVESCKQINSAILKLKNHLEIDAVRQCCQAVTDQAKQANQTMRATVTQMFLEEGGENAAWNAMKYSEFFFKQEKVLKRAKKAAQTIEEVVLENA